MMGSTGVARLIKGEQSHGGKVHEPTSAANVSSSETTTSTVYDRLYVEVRNTAGTLLGTLGTFSNLDKGTAGVYSQKSFSLASWKGQTVRLQFRATTDSSLVTSFRLDDVSLR